MRGFSALVDELARRASLGDPLRSFMPTFKQSKFIEAVKSRKYSECHFLAANRSGKTAVGCYVGASFARQVRGFTDKPTSGWVVSLDFPMSRDTVQPYYFDNGFGVGIEPFIPDYEIRKWDRQAQVLFLKNGSQVGFKSCDSGASKFQAAGKDWVHKDEARPKNIDDEISIRVKAGSPLIQWSTCTLLPPEGKSADVHWIYQEVVKPWKLGEKKWHITNASIYDNPHIRKEEIEALEAKYPLGSMSRRIRLDGELLPGISGTLVYAAFSHSRHTTQGLELDPHYPVLLAWDFNVSPMCSLICQWKNGRLFFIRELWMEEGSISEMCDLFRSGVSTLYPVWLYGDATGKARSAHTRQTSYQIIVNELASRGYIVKMHVPESNPAVTDRINSVNVAMSSHEGESKVVADASCKELITDFESVVYDKNNGIKKVSEHSDPYRWRTHTSDAAGYVVHRLMPVKAWKSGQATKIKQVVYG